jgi:hypothetical protein
MNDAENQKACKPRLDLLERAADEQIAQVMAEGARKYGLRNYTTKPMPARVIGAAIRRHTAAWLSGEDIDPDSGVSHLAHIGANVHVMLAAIEAGTFVDDRKPTPPNVFTDAPRNFWPPSQWGPLDG